MSFWSILLTFLPWIAFKVILLIPLFDELLMVKIGITVAAAICVYQSYTGLNKGLIAWGSVSFFVASLVMVVGLTNIWYLYHLGVFANGTLALLTWISILFGNPFTLSYAKQSVDPKYWDSPSFIHKNYKITAAWGISFTVCVVDSLVRLRYHEIPWYVSEVIDDASMLAAIIFTKHFSKLPQQNQIDEVVTTEG
ncbi:MAG: hypothetical protein ABSC19_08705 [Syntrophorhabdales bacterium]